MSTVDVGGIRVLVGVAATGDEKRVWLFLGDEKCAGGVVRVAHVSDEGEVGGEIDRGGLAVVGKGEDAFRRRDVDGFAVA